MSTAAGANWSRSKRCVMSAKLTGRTLARPGQSSRRNKRVRGGGDRNLDAFGPRRADAPEDAPFLGDRLEQVDVPANRLRRAQEEEASLVEGKMQERDDLLLDLRLQVDQQVSADDEIEFGERRVGDQVLAGKESRSREVAC